MLRDDKELQESCQSAVGLSRSTYSRYHAWLLSLQIPADKVKMTQFFKGQLFLVLSLSVLPCLWNWSQMMGFLCEQYISVSLPAKDIQPDVVKRPAADEKQNQKRLTCHEDKEDITHQCHILNLTLINSFPGMMEFREVIRFSAAIPWKKKAQNFLWKSFYTKHTVSDILKSWSGMCLGCGIHAKLRFFSLFHTKAQGQHSQKAGLL